MARHVLILGGLAAALVIAACGSGDEQPPAPRATGVQSTADPPGTPGISSTAGAGATSGDAATSEEVRPGIPDVDLTKSIVELSDVHFDTFDGGSIPLDQASIDVRRRLFDAIRPLDDPRYDPAADGDWLNPLDLVIGYEAGDEAFAFPHKILNFHEIVNDVFDGVPVLVSYCPLCRSGVVFDRRLGGVELEFSNTSALYESDLVMVDRQTGSYWWQVPGRAIVGTLSGEELTVLPSVTTTWEDWVARHPQTLVLSRDTGSPIDYTRDPFAGYQERVDGGQFAFPVDEDALDARLSPGSLIVGVEVGDTQRAYPIEALGPGPINDVVGGRPVALFVWEGGAAAFSPLSGGEALTFVAAGERFVDEQTESVWTREGVAIEGRLAGTTLELLPSRSTFWFAYVGAFPGAEVYVP